MAVSSQIFERSPASIDVLDGLRALAILLVLLRHVVRPFSDAVDGALLPLGSFDLANLLINGWIGVDLFFVLSGFLIAHHMLTRDNGAGALKNYWRYFSARALRILPAYYATLLLVLAGVFPSYTIASGDLAWRLLYHGLLLQDVLPADINVVFWSLGVEWKFYLFLPFVLVIQNAKSRTWLLCLLLFVPLVARMVLATNSPDVVTYGDFFPTFRSPFYACLDGLVIGVLIALIYQKRAVVTARINRAKWHGIFWLSAAGLILLVGFQPLIDNGADRFAQIFLQLFLAVLWGGIVLALLFGGGPVAFFSHKAFLALARLSYAAYLVHLPLIPAGMMVTKNWLGDSAMSTLGFGLCLAVVLVLTSLVSLVLHVFLEKPMMRLPGKRVSQTSSPAPSN